MKIVRLNLSVNLLNIFFPSSSAILRLPPRSWYDITHASHPLTSPPYITSLSAWHQVPAHNHRLHARPRPRRSPTNDPGNSASARVRHSPIRASSTCSQDIRRDWADLHLPNALSADSFGSSEKLDVVGELLGLKSNGYFWSGMRSRSVIGGKEQVLQTAFWWMQRYKDHRSIYQPLSPTLLKSASFTARELPHTRCSLQPYLHPSFRSSLPLQ
jgi:hypothetical protein